jgi:hypothetical protein
MSVPEPRRTWLALLGLLAVAGWATTIVASQERSSARRPSGPSLQYAITYQRGRREIKATTSPVTLYQRAFLAVGRPVLIRWYDSNVEMTTFRETARIALVIDGTPVTSMVKTSLNYTFEDGQGDMIWMGTLPRGRHTVAVRIDSTGPLGLPYTDPGHLGIDELVLQNVRTGAA